MACGSARRHPHQRRIDGTPWLLLARFLGSTGRPASPLTSHRTRERERGQYTAANGSRSGQCRLAPARAMLRPAGARVTLTPPTYPIRPSARPAAPHCAPASRAGSLACCRWHAAAGWIALVACLAGVVWLVGHTVAPKGTSTSATVAIWKGTLARLRCARAASACWTRRGLRACGTLTLRGRTASRRTFWRAGWLRAAWRPARWW